MLKLVSIAIFISSVSGIVHSRPLFPKLVTDFNVYAKQTINYKRSDFQGAVGSGDQILLENFSILDIPAQRIIKSKASVITRDFFLNSGKVFYGDVVATGQVSIQNGRVMSRGIYSPLINIINGGYTHGAYSNHPRRYPDLTHYNFQLDTILDRLNSWRSTARAAEHNNQWQVFSAVEDDKRLNVFEVSSLSKNILISNNGDAREYFIIFINEKKNATLVNTNFKLINKAHRSNILFVFPEAKTLKIARSGSGLGDRMVGIPASIFAPNTDVTFTDGLLTGSLFAKNLIGFDYSYNPGGQINNGQFLCFATPMLRSGVIDFSRCSSPQENSQRQQKY